ncbi:MAG: type II secretion system protein N [Gemmobacter sp.]
MTRLQERGLLLCAATLALAAVGAQGWSLWVRLGDSAMPMAASASGTSRAATAAEPDLAATMAFAPFGRAEGAAAPDAPVTADTGLDLTLLGITLSANPAASRAILGSPDGTADSFGIGQTLPSGGTLTGVQADHVVIRHGDTETTLRFATDAATLAATPTARTAPGPDLMNLIPTSTTPAAPSPTTTALLTGIKVALGHDHAGYIAGLGLTPAPQGYLLGTQTDGSLQQAGLRPGDLVTAVNGQTPGDPDRDLAILDAVAAAGTAVLQVTRDGQPLTLTVPLE